MDKSELHEFSKAKLKELKDLRKADLRPEARALVIIAELLAARTVHQTEPADGVKFKIGDKVY